MEFKRAFKALTVGGALALLAIGVQAMPAVAAGGTTYYVNSASGSCSDSASGTSQTAPWCSLTKASRSYSAGDSLLLARGSTYAGQQLSVSGQGTSASPITLGAYGSSSAARPIITNQRSGSTQGDPSKADVLLQNPSYWTVQSLQLSYAGAGVVADYNSKYPGSVTGNAGLVFDDLQADHIAGITNGSGSGGQNNDCSGNAFDLWQSGGIAVTGQYSNSYTSSTTFVDGVRVSNSFGTHNLDLVNIDTCDAEIGSPSSPGAALPNLVKNVDVINVSAKDGDGNGYASQCNEGMRFDGVTNVRIVGTEMKNLGACHVNGGTAGVILVSTSNVTIANSTLTDVPNTSSADQTGLDNELYVDRTNLWNNLIARNAGPGVEYLSLRCGISDYNSNHSVIGNAFAGNASSMKRLDNCNPHKTFSGSIQSNLVADSTFLDPVDPFLPLIPNNADNEWVTAGTAPYNAGDQFSSTAGQNGWGYQVSSNTSSSTAWTNATYQADSHVFGSWVGSSGQGVVSKFDQQPGSCASCGSARTWTAPTAGTIAIRSRAAKSTIGGAAVTASVQWNGTAVSTANVAASDATGRQLNANITVAAGDVIRFVVAGAGSANDWTTWSPSIAYVDPGTAQNAQIANGSFENPVLGTNQYAYSPQTPYWSFAAQSSTVGNGVAANGSAFNNAAAPNGRQVALLQWAGSMSQSVAGFKASTSYTLALQAASRPNYAGQSVQVLVDNQPVGTITPSSTSFAAFTTPAFQPGAGTHVITLRGTATSDQTAFIDDVHLLQVTSGAVGNGSFEQPARSAGALAYSPTDSVPWSFAPQAADAGAGVVGNGSAFGQANAPDGSLAGFVQWNGYAEQAISNLPSGALQLKLRYAARQGNSQTVRLQVDGVTVDTFTANATGYTSWTSKSFTVSGGASAVHTIRLQGVAGSDQTAFVDAVSLQAAS